MGSPTDLIERGIEIADSEIYRQAKIWSKYSNDKVDIGEHLAQILRVLAKALPLNKGIKALSIGSSNEPQFRILQTACQAGLHLLDIDQLGLDTVKERIQRQDTHNVFPILQDYNKIFHDRDKTRTFQQRYLNNKRMELITLHHSLYYSQESMWLELMKNLYQYILAPKGIIHAVLMSNQSNDRDSTTWLYNHFAGKFFQHHNNQSLEKLRDKLKKEKIFAKVRIMLKTHRIRFFVDDFEKFMAVVWMILLHPQVHEFRAEQKREVTEFVYRNFFEKKKPMVQIQNHLTLYR